MAGTSSLFTHNFREKCDLLITFSFISLSCVCVFFFSVILLKCNEMFLTTEKKTKWTERDRGTEKTSIRFETYNRSFLSSIRQGLVCMCAQNRCNGICHITLTHDTHIHILMGWPWGRAGNSITSIILCNWNWLQGDEWISNLQSVAAGSKLYIATHSIFYICPAIELVFSPHRSLEKWAYKSLHFSMLQKQQHQ